MLLKVMFHALAARIFINLNNDNMYKVEKNVEVTSCSECDGDGEVEWSYGMHSMNADCPECDGEGTLSPFSNDYMVVDEDGNKLYEGMLYHCEAWIIQKESGYI